MIPVTKQYPQKLITNQPYHIIQCNYPDNTCFYFSFHDRTLAESCYGVAIFKVTPKTK